MADLNDTPEWEAGVYQIETTDPVLGGAPNPATGAGMTNIPHLQLARRTAFLRQELIALQASFAAISAEFAQVSSLRSVVGPVLVATTGNIALTGLQTIDGVGVTAGRRVLVKDQTAPAQNGVYVAAVGAWARAADFNDATDFLPGCLVSVTAGTTQADTLWTLSNQNEGATITIGSSPLAFSNVTALCATLASPAFTGNPTAPTPAQFDNDTSIATTAFVQRALGGFAGNVQYTVDGVVPAANAGLRGAWTSGTAGALTLPSFSSVPIGSSFYFVAASAAVTIAPSGADEIIQPGNVSTGTLSLSVGDDVLITRVGGNWAITGGSLRRGNYRDAMTLGGSVTLTAQDAGKCFVYGDTAAITITLPTIAATPIGSAFDFINTSTANVTVQRAGSDQIDSGPTSVTSIVIPPNQSLRLVRARGSSLWHPVGQTAQARNIEAPGVAPVYACRAWVNFNGAGAIAIRGSGNISSITDNGVGDYTLNFATSMPDANFAVSGAAKLNNDTSITVNECGILPCAFSTSSVRVLMDDDASPRDPAIVNVMIFR